MSLMVTPTNGRSLRCQVPTVETDETLWRMRVGLRTPPLISCPPDRPRAHATPFMVKLHKHSTPVQPAYPSSGEGVMFDPQQVVDLYGRMRVGYTKENLS